MEKNSIKIVKFYLLSIPWVELFCKMADRNFDIFFFFEKCHCILSFTFRGKEQRERFQKKKATSDKRYSLMEQW